MHSLESVICLPQRDAAAHHFGRTIGLHFSRSDHSGLRPFFGKGGVLWPVPLLLNKLIGDMERDFDTLYDIPAEATGVYNAVRSSYCVVFNV